MIEQTVFDFTILDVQPSQDYAYPVAQFALASDAVNYMIGDPLECRLAIRGFVTNFTPESNFKSILAARKQIRGF